jgi:hypothetical protein
MYILHNNDKSCTINKNIIYPEGKAGGEGIELPPIPPESKK